MLQDIVKKLQAGLFIAFEGIDASGKTKQLKRLHHRLQDLGLAVEIFDFPNYQAGSSYFLKKHLRGDYGSLSAVNPQTASLFFALDRYDSKQHLLDALKAKKIVLSNRFSASNLAYQGAKLDSDQRVNFWQWLTELEVNILGLPQPDLNIFLDVSGSKAHKLLQKRSRKYQYLKQEDRQIDIYEQDLKYQRLAHQIYLDLCTQFPASFRRIICQNQRGDMLPQVTINDLIWQTINDYLDN